jgi:hypothetical protein
VHQIAVMDNWRAPQNLKPQSMSPQGSLIQVSGTSPRP